MKSKTNLKTILLYAGSSFLATAAAAVYTLTDQLFVSNALGETGLSAIGVASPVVLFLAAIGTILKVGGGEQISSARGKKDAEQANRTILITLSLAVLSGVLIAILGILFSRSFVNGADAKNMQDMLDMAVSYIRILCISAPFLLLSYCFETILRCLGKPGLALASVCFSSILNVILDPLFIFGFHWGIEGAAYATMLAQLAGVIACSLYFAHTKSITFHFVSLDRSILTSIFRIGIAFGLADIVLTIVETVVNVILVQHEAITVLSGFSIINACLSILYLPVAGIDNGTQPLVSEFHSANQREDCEEVIRKSFQLSFGFCTVCYLLVLFFTEPLVHVFLPSEVEHLALLVWIVRVAFCVQPMVAILTSSMGTMAALGDEKYNILLSILPLFIQVPILLIFPTILPIEAVTWNYPICDLLMGILSLWMLAHFLKQRGYSLRHILFPRSHSNVKA